MFLRFFAIQLTLNNKHIRVVQSFLEHRYFIGSQADKICLVFKPKGLLLIFLHELWWKHIWIDIFLLLRFFKRFKLNFTAQLVLSADCYAFTLEVCQFVDIFHFVNHFEFVFSISFRESEFHVFTYSVESHSIEVVE